MPNRLRLLGCEGKREKTQDGGGGRGGRRGLRHIHKTKEGSRQQFLPKAANIGNRKRGDLTKSMRWWCRY